MKTCSYCGAQYPDDQTECSIDRTSLIVPPSAPKPVAMPTPELPGVDYVFPPLSPEQRLLDWVTLVNCRTLVEADLIASRLRAAGMESFIPDESLMQSIAFKLNTFGYVRLQVTPEDYDAAKLLLSQPSLEG